MNDKIEKAISRRAGYILKNLKPLFEGIKDMSFYIAGGALNGPINDVDLFPVDAENRVKLKSIKNNAEKVLSETRNAITLKCDPWPIQVCNYQKESLEALVRSFDFAHIQVGVRVRWCLRKFVVKEVFFTDDFVVANAINTSWFCGSDFPLSSLIRTGKYYKRGTMPRGAHLRAVIDALTAVVRRGFEGKEDFKDQLDAVDLGLLPEDLEETGFESLKELYELLDNSAKTKG